MQDISVDALPESERSLVPFLRGLASSRERPRQPLGRRATGIIIALCLEALLLLALLTLGRERTPGAAVNDALTVIQLADDLPEAAETSSRQAEQKATQPAAPQAQVPQPEAIPKPAVEPAVHIPLIELSHDQMAAADISKLPSPSRSGAKMGPPAPSTAGDSERVPGSGPNGEPLYRAAWYREPYDNELRGYLSTAQGPGWGLIACKTVADFRVEDCIGIDEYPKGSKIMRAVLAAAWQFRVRPPRLGGQSQVGAWVRIRIDYSLKRD